MAVTSYSVDCINQTQETWTFVVYLQLPDAPGTESVAWQQITLPKGGQSPLEWTTAIDVCLGKVTAGPPRVYKTTQLLQTEVGTAWNVTASGGIVELVPSGNPPLLPTTVQIQNKTTAKVNVGYGQSGAGAVFAPDVPGNGSVAFYPAPSYWLMLTQNIVAGQVITSGSSVPQMSFLALTPSSVFVLPQQLVFPTGVTTATATAKMDGSSISLVITYA